MGFEIEKKESSEWYTIGFIKGRGTTTQISNYEFFNDLSELNTSTKLSYRLKQIDFNGAFTYSNIVEVDYLPEYYSLSQNYPNPFNPSTSISFTLAKSSFVELKVFNVLGNEVATLVNQIVTAGKHQVTFDAGSLSSGVYLYTIKASDFSETKKMILMK